MVVLPVKESEDAPRRVIEFAADHELDAAGKRASTAFFQAWAGHINPDLAAGRGAERRSP